MNAHARPEDIVEIQRRERFRVEWDRQFAALSQDEQDAITGDPLSPEADRLAMSVRAEVEADPAV